MDHRKGMHYKGAHFIIRIALILSFGLHFLLFLLVGQMKKKEEYHPFIKVVLVDTLNSIVKDVSKLSVEKHTQPAPVNLRDSSPVHIANRKPISTPDMQAEKIPPLMQTESDDLLTDHSLFPQKESGDLVENRLSREGSLNAPTFSLPKKIEDTNQSKFYIHTIYTRLLQQRLHQQKKYPVAAQRRGIEGTVNIKFLIHKDGTVGDIKVLQSSRYAMLDKAAIETIHAGTPYPPFPSGIEEDSIWIVVPIVYSLLE